MVDSDSEEENSYVKCDSRFNDSEIDEPEESEYDSENDYDSDCCSESSFYQLVKDR